jgi:hypothetical protein
MAREIGIRQLDEWIYAIGKGVEDCDGDSRKILLEMADQMREYRAELRMQRHNESGFSPEG